MREELLRKLSGVRLAKKLSALLPMTMSLVTVATVVLLTWAMNLVPVVPFVKLLDESVHCRHLGEYKI